MSDYVEPQPICTDIRVLGPVQLHAPDNPDARGLKSHPKPLALWVYLALEGRGRGISRDRITAIFWPEAEARRARAALRQTCRMLRGFLGDESVWNEGKQFVGVDLAVVGCDALRFGQLMDGEAYRDALDLYRGELMDGFHLGRSNGWDAWLEGQRHQLRAWAADGAWALAMRAEADADRTKAAFWGKRALALSGRNELAARRLMQLLDRLGDGVGAMRAYRGLEEWMAEELGMQPAEETQRLAQVIRGRTNILPQAASGRRAGSERRSGPPRRQRDVGPRGRERRRGQDRRQADQRRSGDDRRRPPP